MSNQNHTEKRHIKSYEELEFTDDFLFCKILENNVDLCRELTELILGRKIGKILPLESQKSIEITADGKGVRFDVYMEDDDQTIYDIEMQQAREQDLPKRMRYYQGMIDLSQLERGAKYAELKNSYIIFICCEKPFPESSRHIYCIKNVCVEDPLLNYSDGTSKVILTPVGEEDDVSDEMKQFLRYLNDRSTGSELTRRLQMKVDESRQHKRWRVEYMTLLERDEKMREEGREEGKKEGKKEGREEILDLLCITGKEREEILAELNKRSV